MLEFILQYALFFLKTLTLVVGIVAVLIVLFALIAKQRRVGEDEQLEIIPLNEKFDGMKDALQAEIMSKEALKKLAKAKKKADKEKDEKADDDKKRIYVIDFEGDMRASAANELREIITAILTVATPKDEVFVKIESGGGVVHGYGLAASQLARLKAKNIPLTVAIDKVAASGGYLMAAVANQILAAPFAIVGSIGVIGQMPNFRRLLNKHQIDFEQHTAGQFKRTLTVFGENTDQAREKFQEELEETHVLFKQFVKDNRPSVDIDAVATGEHWYGSRALELKLIDTISTSDDYLLSQADNAAIFELNYAGKKTLGEKLSQAMQAMYHSFMGSLQR